MRDWAPLWEVQSLLGTILLDQTYLFLSVKLVWYASLINMSLLIPLRMRRLKPIRFQEILKPQRSVSVVRSFTLLKLRLCAVGSLTKISVTKSMNSFPSCKTVERDFEIHSAWSCRYSICDTDMRNYIIVQWAPLRWSSVIWSFRVHGQFLPGPERNRISYNKLSRSITRNRDIPPKASDTAWVQGL